MALIGGGGAGNVSGGANPAGVGSGLTYIGDHCYANSGAITVEDSGNAGTTLLDFTTGNAYIVAEIHMFNDQANALDDYVQAFLDGQLILKARYQSASEFHQDQPTKILIPSYSRFQFKASADDSPVKFTAILVGRVYA